MLTVNNSDHPFHEGMTIKTLMDEKGFVFHRIIVKLNGQLIEDSSYDGTLLQDGDNVQAIHVFAGG
jgi:thiamine biosynthesis protein ThiS